MTNKIKFPIFTTSELGANMNKGAVPETLWYLEFSIEHFVLLVITGIVVVFIPCNVFTFVQWENTTMIGSHLRLVELLRLWFYG